MSAPDRIWINLNSPWDGVVNDKYGVGPCTPYLHADGPTITAYREALRMMGLDPDSIAREAEKEAQNG